MIVYVLSGIVITYHSLFGYITNINILKPEVYQTEKQCYEVGKRNEEKNTRNQKYWLRCDAREVRSTTCQIDYDKCREAHAAVNTDRIYCEEQYVKCLKEAKITSTRK